MEEEIISDEQMVLECKEAKETINNVKKNKWIIIIIYNLFNFIHC